MSYILEALKKSEQERARERGALPGIQSVHKSSAELHREERNWWPVILVAILIVAGALVATFYVIRITPDTETVAADDSTMEKDKGAVEITAPVERKVMPPISQSTQHANATPENKPRIATTEQKAPHVVFSEQPLKPENEIGNSDAQQESVVVLENKPVKQEKQLEKPVKKAERTTVAISEIPDSVRKRMPNIAFEGHIYSSVPERRSIMINGRKMREGDSVADRLMIREITPEGAEFEYEGYRFKLNALQDWSFK